ncbi:MAG: hypothetical protein QXU75_07865 [Candidatus Methanomethylicaceae archaeon]
MDPNSQELPTQYLDQLKRIEKLLSTVIKLDQEREKNLYKLRNELSRIDNLNLDPELIRHIKEWLENHRLVVANEEERIKKEFPNELERQLAEIGIELSGHYPKLKAGLFTIVINFEKLSVSVWYGPEQERLFQCALSPKEVATRIKEKRESLGSKLDEEGLFQQLKTAYHRALSKLKSENGLSIGNSVPIIKIYTEMSSILGKERFNQDPHREHHRSYSRADFSFDLYRLNSYGKEFILKTATREFTKTRAGFLWVPTNEDGAGSTYSHLEIPE